MNNVKEFSILDLELHERILCQNCDKYLLPKSPSFDYWNLQCPSCRNAIWLPKKAKAYIKIHETKFEDFWT